VELLRQRKGGAVGNESGGVAVELLGQRKGGAVGAKRAVVENWITNSLIDRACNGAYDEQSKQQKRAENDNSFHEQTPPGNRVNRSGTNVGKIGKTFRDRNGKL